MAKQGFTVPKLHDCGGNIKKEWYVSFRMTDPETGERKPFPHRRGLNYLHTKEERYTYGNDLAKLLKNALNEGWNPFVTDFESYCESLKVAEPEPVPTALELTELDYSRMPFNQALQFALDSRSANISKASVKEYRTVLNFATAAAARVGGSIKLSEIPVGDIKRPHMKLLLDQMQKDRTAAYKDDYVRRLAKEAERSMLCKRKSMQYTPKQIKPQKFTGNTYNKYRDTLYTLFSELEEYDAVEYNPCSKISDKPEIDTDKYRHASAVEEQMIKSYLKEVHFRFYVYLAFIEVAALRPKEIYSLQIQDIDWLNQWVSLWEDEAKTRMARKVPIPNVLVPLIQQLKLNGHPGHFYIFSEGMEPGPRRVNRDKATKLWGKLVRRDLGLDVRMYSFKGLGGEKKREADIDLSVVSRQSFGHTNVRTSKIYLEREDERSRRQIIENTPAFEV